MSRLKEHVGRFFFNLGKKVLNEDIEEFIRDESKDILRICFDGIEAEDVMIQRSEIRGICLEDPILDSLSLLVNENNSSDIIPVFKKNLDDVYGCIKLGESLNKLIINKDSAKILSDFNAQKQFYKSIVYRIKLISPSMKLKHIMDDIKLNKTQMFVVVDEFGGSQGFVTNQSIINFLSIAGGSPQFPIEPNEHGNLIIDSKMLLEDFLEVIKNFFAKNKPNDDTEDMEIVKQINKFLDETRTVGGFVCSFTGRIPVINETIQVAEITFQVKEADLRRIKTLEVFFLDDNKKKKK